MFYDSLKYFNKIDKFWLLWGAVAYRLMKLVPKHVFRTKNFLESAKKAGFKVWKEGSLFKVESMNSICCLLRNGTSDPLVFQQIIIDEEFKNVVNLIKKSNIKIERILDAGANIGLTTLYLKDHFKNTHVICVEPDSENFTLLEQNLQLNNVDNVHLVKGGVWVENGWLEMDYDFRDGLEWARSLKLPQKGSGSIPVYQIDDILKQCNWESVDLLKLDIEGAESEIFKEDSSLEFLKKAQVITIEVHNHYQDGHRIISALINHGFNIHFSGELLIGIK